MIQSLIRHAVAHLFFKGAERLTQAAHRLLEKSVEPDQPIPRQDPLTPESLAMMADRSVREDIYVPEPPLAGSARERYARSRQW